MLATGFSIYQSSKHPVLQPIWEVSEAEVRSMAEPGAECLDMLPGHIAETLTTWAAPAALIFASYMVIAPRVRAERETILQFQEQERAARASGQRHSNQAPGPPTGNGVSGEPANSRSNIASENPFGEFIR